jgi:hypothetical protein
MLNPNIFIKNNFNNSTIKFVNNNSNYIEQIKQLNSKYIDNSNYVFTSIKTNSTGWIIILKRSESTITD